MPTRHGAGVIFVHLNEELYKRSWFLLSMDCEPCPLNRPWRLAAREAALAGRGHGLTGPPIRDAARAWLALLPWPDLGVASLLLSCEVRGRELTSLPTGPASPGYFKCRDTLTPCRQPEKLTDNFLECLVWQEQSHHQGRGRLSWGSPNAWVSPSFPQHLARWAAQLTDHTPALCRLENSTNST